MYVTIRRYETTSVEEVARRVQQGFVPIMRQAPGYIAYYAIDAGAGFVASISIFETQAQADDSTRLAAEWVRQNIVDLFTGPPELTSGQVIAH
jgi:hypothetical protein